MEDLLKKYLDDYHCETEIVIDKYFLPERSTVDLMVTYYIGADSKVKQALNISCWSLLGFLRTKIK